VLTGYARLQPSSHLRENHFPPLGCGIHVGCASKSRLPIASRGWSGPRRGYVGTSATRSASSRRAMSRPPFAHADAVSRGDLGQRLSGQLGDGCYYCNLIAFDTLAM
jgi:hypothetical protein